VMPERFEWTDPASLAERIRAWAAVGDEVPDVGPIEAAVAERGDEAVLELTARFDATEAPPARLRVDPGAAPAALDSIEPEVRSALELAAANIRAVAEAQLGEPVNVELPQGQSVEVREVPVGAAGVYAPGGRAAYPSTVLMGCLPAIVAGVGRVALASPPGPRGELPAVVLAAAAICEVDEIYAMGGAQAIFALALGTKTVAPVDVVAGPGNRWVQEAKRRMSGRVGIDSLAGPSELMLIAGHDTDLRWAALDICAQAEHGDAGLLAAAAVEEAVLDRLAGAVEELSGPDHADQRLALVQVPDLGDAVALANSLAPEHLQLMSADAAPLADHVRTAGCVFVGATAATAFGDYVAGSNHVLPTGGAGRFSGPLGPGTFRRRIANVTLPGRAAEALAPHVEALARAEGFPVHGESARARGSMR
jgi:histidinol dehydrogenase